MSEPDNIDLTTLPEPVQAHIKELRGEAAKHRVAKREVETKYQEAGELLAAANTRLEQFDGFKSKAEKFDKLTEDHEKLLASNASVSDQFTRLKIASEFGIPEEADRLKGGTPEELKADAETFAKKIQRTGGLPSNPAGLTPPPAAPQTSALAQALRQSLGLAE